ncbi:hypothetical protein [Sulfurimonas sp. HSL3-7]|uniref:hypothetical protein n=1 Tax=Sulfonitrofixus jiaomeiensis TaxID=3131938 RepID=UPI0031F94C02
MRHYLKRIKRPTLNKEEIREKVLLLKAQSHNEYKETLIMLRLLYKQVKSEKEKAFIRQQAADIVKISIVLVIAALPTGTIAVAFLEIGFRKINRTILPTSFSETFRQEFKQKNDV